MLRSNYSAVFSVVEVVESHSSLSYLHILAIFLVQLSIYEPYCVMKNPERAEQCQRYVPRNQVTA